MPVHVTDIPCDCSLPYCTGLSHTHICVSEQPLWLTDRADFETLLNIKQQRFWMKLKDEVRAEFCWNLCMHGFQAIQTVGTFSFFCSNVLSCNNSRRLKPCVLCLLRECFAGLQRVYVGTHRSGIDSRGMLSSTKMWEARNTFRHFYDLSECPLWDRSWGFSRLMQTLFWCYSTEGLSLLPVLVCVTYTSCARANRHCLLNPAINKEILSVVFLQSCSREFLLL